MTNPNLEKLTHFARRMFDESCSGEQYVCPAEGLVLYRHGSGTSMKPSIYDPIACLILQGQKEAVAGERRIILSPGDLMLVSHEVPVISKINCVSGEPYLAVVVFIDTNLLANLYHEVAPHLPSDADSAEALSVDQVDDELLDVLCRYCRAANSPAETEVVLPMVRRELHFRFLMASQGAMLRRLIRHDSHASNIARAMRYIRDHYQQSIAVPDLASFVGMSSSSLHKHFKAVTSTTPLQYQKEIRLTEARQLLARGDTVSSVAYEVGYESPNQFSREFSRKFGHAPSQAR